MKRPIVLGDAAALADELRAADVDGFLIEPDTTETFEWFATEVAPLVRNDDMLVGATLRERFGLERPANRYVSRSRSTSPRTSRA